MSHHDRAYWDEHAKNYDRSMALLGGPIPRMVELAGEAEVGDDGVALGVDDDVSGFEVAVDDAVDVGIFHGLGDVAGEAGGFGAEAEHLGGFWLGAECGEGGVDGGGLCATGTELGWRERQHASREA